MILQQSTAQVRFAVPRVPREYDQLRLGKDNNPPQVIQGYRLKIHGILGIGELLENLFHDRAKRQEAVKSLNMAVDHWFQLGWRGLGHAAENCYWQAACTLQH
ncbi:hypothetical protein GCM10023212_11420 [Luteolibacter yonseiensis]